MARGDEMPDFQISKVMACRCAEHAWVYLDDRAGSETVKVQVPIVTGRSLAGMIGGRAPREAGALDLVAAVLVAFDARPSCVALGCRDGEATAYLSISTAAGRCDIPTSMSTALVAAWHLKLPIRLDPAGGDCRTSDIPAPFRSVLQSLDLSGLGHND